MRGRFATRGWALAPRWRGLPCVPEGRWKLAPGRANERSEMAFRRRLAGQCRRALATCKRPPRRRHRCSGSAGVIRGEHGFPFPRSAAPSVPAPAASHSSFSRVDEVSQRNARCRAALAFFSCASSPPASLISLRLLGPLALWKRAWEFNRKERKERREKMAQIFVFPVLFAVTELPHFFFGRLPPIAPWASRRLGSSTTKSFVLQRLACRTGVVETAEPALSLPNGSAPFNASPRSALHFILHPFQEIEDFDPTAKRPTVFTAGRLMNLLN